MGVFEALGEAVGAVFKAFGNALMGFLAWFFDVALAQSDTAKAHGKDKMARLGEEGFARVGKETGLRSPDPRAVNTATAAFYQTLTRVLYTTRPVGPKGLPAGGEVHAGLSVAGALIAGKVAVEGAGAAIDLAHPLRKMNVWEIFAGITAGLPASAIINRLIMIPLDAACFRPWRYQSNQRNPTEIPSLGQADDMLFHDAISPAEWSKIYAMHGWPRTYQDPWKQSFYVEPTLYTVLAMLSDPEVSETWIRKVLKYRHLSPEDIDMIIAYKKRKLGSKVDVYGESDLITLFKEGFVDEGGFYDHAADLGWPKSVTDQNFKVAELKYEFDYKSDQRALILDRLAKKKINAAQATSELAKIMPAAERVSVLIDRELAKLKA